MIQKIWKDLLDFLSDAENPEEPVYDPAHVAAMIVLVIAATGILFWLLWTMLVFRGGLFSKILPALEVLFTSKTLRDFGWVGYPYELGVFSGFIANGAALLLTLGFIYGLWWLFKKTEAAATSNTERPQ